MNIIKHLENRYATKKFDATKTVSNSKIEKLKKAFQLTPTSFNLQPIKMVIVEDKNIQKKLLPHCFGQQQVVDASHLLVLCTDESDIKSQIEYKFEIEKEIRNTSDDILSKFKEELTKKLSQNSDEALKTMKQKQLYIVLGTLLTVCASEKIDCCPMQGFIPQKIDDILGLHTYNLKSVLLFPVGHRAEDDFVSRLPKVRKPLNKLIIKI